MTSGPTERPVSAEEAGLAALVAEKDWSKTPLGPAANWPQSLRTVLNILLTSRYAMWMGWGKDLTFFYNDAYRPTLGIKHPWALGSMAAEVWAEIWDDIGPRIDKVLTTGVATYDEGLLLYLHRSGFSEETYHTFSYSPLLDDSGAVSGMLCVVTEETERVISERRMSTLREFASALSRAKIEHEVLETVRQQLSSNLRDLPFTLTYIFDSTGNAQLRCKTGAPAGRLAANRIPAYSNAPWPASDIFRGTGSSLLDIPDGADGNDSTLPRQAFVVPIRQQGQDRPAGLLIVGANPHRSSDDAYAGFIGLVADQLAAALANANAYEEERQRAEALAELDRAKTLFFSNVSHEFRTPLTLMMGPVEDLLADFELNADTEKSELLQVVQRNGMRLQKLVNNLLDFSRIEAGRSYASYQPTDLASYTAELASAFRSAMQRANLTFTVECDALSEPVYVDPEMWEKVVLNLISNAFKYTLSGSIAVRLAERDGSAEFSVTDTGVGIPEEELPHIFERFHRVEGTLGRTQEGTGIGLALVHELIKLHGGTVTATSDFGKGSTFRVSLIFGVAHLPQERLEANRELNSTAVRATAYVEEALRWLPANGAQAASASTATSIPREGRVIVADDNADMRNYVSRLLSAQYDVRTVTNGEEALAAAIADPPDLVLSDVMMPGLDGFGLLSSLRQNPATKAIPVILLSARAGEEASVEGLQAGADDYLTKPFSARELLARVGSRLQLKLERQRIHERLAHIFSQAPVAIAVLRGRDLVFDLANPSYHQLLPGRQLLGRPLAAVIPELNTRVLDILLRVLETGEAFSANDFLISYDQDQDGISEDHWFNFLYHPLRELDGEVSSVIAAVTEVTAQVRARDELLKADRELEEFAYVASHDLREPLRMINIYTQLLLKRTGMEEDPEQKEFASFVRAGVHRMEDLIQDLLDYSQVVHSDQEAFGRVDLNAALSKAIEILHLQIKETEAVITCDPMPVVLGEEPPLTQVFQNLLSNSLKYRSKSDVPRIHVAAERDGGEWIISVEDNGIGFEAEYAMRIFGLFKRLHKVDYPGTGLGLAICKRVVERFGGRMWADSQGTGRGSKFYFALRAGD
ncbi:MAG: ATP-binding protein [Bryobacteraceae bacterium]